jgi:transcriptional antiterminator RfaH
MPLLPLEPFIHPEGLLQADSDFVEPSAWWVLHTRPRAEKALARKLLGEGLDFFLPLYKKQLHSRARRLSSHLPLFPGYVFLRGDAEVRLCALKSNLVANALPVADTRQLRSDLARVWRVMQGEVPLLPEERLQPGTEVEVTAGPLEGLQGKVLRRGKQLRLVIEVRLLQQGVSVEVEDWMIRPFVTAHA